MESSMNVHTGNPALLGFRLATAATIALALGFGAAMVTPLASAAPGDADDQAMVDCMLPGQIQRLNNNVMIMGARHPIRTTRADCHVRGGEFHDADRAADAAVDADHPATVHHVAKTHRKARHTAKTVKPASTTTK
jgi:hypothetical protein